MTLQYLYINATSDVIAWTNGGGLPVGGDDRIAACVPSTDVISWMTVAAAAGTAWALACDDVTKVVQWSNFSGM